MMFQEITFHPTAGPCNVERFCNQGERYGDPEDCLRYYQCVSGSIENLACANGTYYDTNTSRCVYQEFAECELPCPTTPPPTPVTLKPLPSGTSKTAG